MKKIIVNIVIAVVCLLFLYLLALGLSYMDKLDKSTKQIHDQRLIDQGKKECLSEHNYKESDVIYVDGARYVPAS